MGKKTVEDCDVRGKRVLLRVDFNVPLDKESGAITNDERIRAALPTIRYLLDKDARLIIMSHLGRPKGQVVDSLRLDPVAARLSELLGQPVAKVDDCIGPVAEAAVAALQPGEALLLENVRFHPEEEKNNHEFIKQLAALGDIFVNDAFGTAHRAHASTEGIGHFLPAVAGFLMKKEISALARAGKRPVRPYVAIIGGAKISDKILVIEELMKIADKLIIGGGMANTFLAAQGYDMQASLVEADKIETAKALLAKQAESGKTFLLPQDVVVGKSLEDAQGEVKAVDALAPGDMALDIGPVTRAAYVAALADAKTIFWNGPMGVFEKDAFAAGTNALAQGVADSSAYTIIGGGDSVAAVEKAGLGDQINHISTGGGASLVFLEGRMLPGLAVLEEREDDPA
ncbi:phosphoglycerate kinase [Peptococcus niger]|uniref:Phosphoglycerate kinase n=1 Tax=Peptococcus niger TaxID=2741 RepID=A0A1G6VMJ9_PEPNI|nr:phosphoglycerate kinase [Peptococcus niger]SDD54633.1 phosphoglycerate kinase [Peptococcus niger]